MTPDERSRSAGPAARRAAEVDVRILDYGVGNLHSLRKALEHAGAQASVTSSVDELLAADAVVLPGVGAFGDAAKRVAPYRDALESAVGDGKPLLGVCLGMQLLFEESAESPGAQGLGLIRGRVESLRHGKIPQIGWNVLAFNDQDPLFTGLSEGAHVYYVNSYAPVPRESVTVGTSTYGSTFTSVVRKRNAWGTQFHPEKSSRTGLTMVRNFVAHARAVKEGTD